MIPFLLIAALATGARTDSLPIPPGVPPGGLRGTLANSAPDSVAAADLASHPVSYLWVVRTSLLSPADLDAVIARARSMGVRGLLVQVVGRGDAWYRSDLLPRAEALPRPAPGEEPFDPLGYLLPRARAAGLEVHAWMNCCLVWSGPHRPRDPRHVVVAHPEWIARLANGRKLSQLRPRELQRLRIEGTYLNPTHPGVRTWVAAIAAEIARRYPVDGIHLDYIRLPSSRVALDPATRAAFALRTGVDPAPRASRSWLERARLDSAFTAFQCEQVTAIVQEVRDSLAACRPDVVLSAAVKSNVREAEHDLAQAWPGWLALGLLDRVFVMCYAPVTQVVLEQLVGLAGRVGTVRLVPGLAVYNAPPATVAATVKGAHELGFHTLALYSYDALFSRPSYWPALRDKLAPAGPAANPEGTP